MELRTTATYPPRALTAAWLILAASGKVHTNRIPIGSGGIR